MYMKRADREIAEQLNVIGRLLVLAHEEPRTDLRHEWLNAVGNAYTAAQGEQERKAAEEARRRSIFRVVKGGLAPAALLLTIGYAVRRLWRNPRAVDITVTATTAALVTAGAFYIGSSSAPDDDPSGARPPAVSRPPAASPMPPRTGSPSPGPGAPVPSLDDQRPVVPRPTRAPIVSAANTSPAAEPERTGREGEQETTPTPPASGVESEPPTDVEASPGGDDGEKGDDENGPPAKGGSPRHPCIHINVPPVLDLKVCPPGRR